MSLEILKQCFSNLAQEMYITKETNGTYCTVAMTTVLQLVMS